MVSQRSARLGKNISAPKQRSRLPLAQTGRRLPVAAQPLKPGKDHEKRGAKHKAIIPSSLAIGTQLKLLAKHGIGMTLEVAVDLTTKFCKEQVQLEVSRPGSGDTHLVKLLEQTFNASKLRRACKHEYVEISTSLGVSWSDLNPKTAGIMDRVDGLARKSGYLEHVRDLVPQLVTKVEDVLFADVYSTEVGDGAEGSSIDSEPEAPAAPEAPITPEVAHAPPEVAHAPPEPYFPPVTTPASESEVPEVIISEVIPNIETEIALKNAFTLEAAAAVRWIQYGPFNTGDVVIEDIVNTPFKGESDHQIVLTESDTAAYDAAMAKLESKGPSLAMATLPATLGGNALIYPMHPAAMLIDNEHCVLWSSADYMEEI